MLLNTLCDYYDILLKNGEITPDGYSKVTIDYIVYLTSHGEIDDIVDCENKTADKSYIILPKRTEQSAINANYIEHRFRYLFGLDYNGNAFTTDDSKNKIKKSHNLFVEKNLKFIDGLNSPIVNAYREFLRNWNPEKEKENKFILQIGKKITTSKLAIGLAGDTAMLHDDPGIKARWESIYSQRAEPSKNDVISQCAITGQPGPIAKTHDKIRGLNNLGACLVSFKGSAFESYNNTQGYNANVSKESMKKYTTSLNYLLSDTKHRFAFGDITIVHWGSNLGGTDLINTFLFGDSTKTNSEQSISALEDFNQFVKNGGNINNIDTLDFLNDIEEDVKYNLVGLKPNSGRLSVKFMYQKNLREMIINICKHKIDMFVGYSIDNSTLWRIKNAFYSQKIKKTIDPNIISGLLNAIINGVEYPKAILSETINQIRKGEKIDATRAGIANAYINRSTT